MADDQQTQVFGQPIRKDVPFIPSVPAQPVHRTAPPVERPKQPVHTP